MKFIELSKGNAIIHSEHSLQKDNPNLQLLKALKELPYEMTLTLNDSTWMRVSNVYTKTTITPVMSN